MASLVSIANGTISANVWTTGPIQGGTFQLDSTKFIADLKAALAIIDWAIPSALEALASNIMLESINQVPEDTGALRISVFQNSAEAVAEGYQVSMGYGNPAVTSSDPKKEPPSAYAEVQHEDLGYRHRIGNAKYLEIPVLNAAGTAADFIGDLVNTALG